MNQTKYREQRDKWLDEVSNTCHNYALKNDLDFYVFQTPVDDYNPELLIIGINPGGGKAYSTILQEKGYDKRSASDLAYDVNTLTTKPEWEKKGEPGNDVMRRQFKKLFSKENGFDSILENTVMMNMVYFNTPKETDLSKIDKDARAYCITKTIEFIEILNPKHIVFLTSNPSNLKKSTVTDIKPLGNFIKSGVINNRTIYSIPHYGSRAEYSNVNLPVMAKALSKLLK